MKQKLGISCCYGIVFILCSALMFILGFTNTPAFWIGYLCSLMMLALCLLVIWKDGFFSGIAHLRYSLGMMVTVFFCVQLLLGWMSTFLLLPWFLVAEVVLLGVCALVVLPVLLGGNWIIKRQQETYNRQQFIRILTEELSPLPDRVSDMTARKKLENLQEAVRFSDPMGVDASEPLEQRITEQAFNLKRLVELTDWEGLCALCDTLSQLLKERNCRCAESK